MRVSEVHAADTAGSIMDQYVDGIAANAWDAIIGDVDRRLEHYSEFLVEFLRKQNCSHVLDAACGTGIDSIMLLEKGFKVTSVDISDKMLKFALKKRWNRRKEKAFDEWVIEEANWLTLPHDITKPGEGFDTIICIGNSLSQLIDTQGDMANVKLAIRNFHAMLKPGGWLIIDHRNYEAILESGKYLNGNIYYTGIDVHSDFIERSSKRIIRDLYIDELNDKKTDLADCKKENGISERKHFRIVNNPIMLGDFTGVLKSVFGQDSKHDIYGDYKSLNNVENPSFFIHFIQKEQ